MGLLFDPPADKSVSTTSSTIVETLFPRGFFFVMLSTEKKNSNFKKLLDEF
jgi:hypothetical protein